MVYAKIMLDTFKREWTAKAALAFFVFLTLWWVILNLSEPVSQLQNYIFAATYGLMAVLGGVIGFLIAKHWGGFQSVMGRAILAFSFGLLLAEFGQLIWSYHNIFLNVEMPYPSIADIGFFANIPLYSIGIILLAKASGIRFRLQKFGGKLFIVILPVFMLIISYLFFLQDYEFDWSDPLLVFLDFAYPLGQAFYVSLALLVYILSKNILGGIMRTKILFLLFACVAQYIADYNFLFQNSRGTWINGGYGDYLYLLAYFVMTIALLQLKTVFHKLKE